MGARYYFGYANIAVAFFSITMGNGCESYGFLLLCLLWTLPRIRQQHSIAPYLEWLQCVIIV